MKVGLIGCGEISHFHMDTFKRLKNVEIVAVSDILFDRAKNFANRWGVNKYFIDYHELLEMEELDFVDICTPVWTHAAIAIDTKSIQNVKRNMIFFIILLLIAIILFFQNPLDLTNSSYHLGAKLH